MGHLMRRNQRRSWIYAPLGILQVRFQPLEIDKPFLKDLKNIQNNRGNNSRVFLKMTSRFRNFTSCLCAVGVGKCLQKHHINICNNGLFN